MTKRAELSSQTASPQADGHLLTSTATPLAKAPEGIPQPVLHLIALAILIFLNLLCYCRTLNGYFLADDFVHVAYLADVFNGHPFKLLENFTGNWMHAWGTQFYRPLISLTLAFDYLLGQGNAAAFHISNTLFHIASSILVYVLTGKLLQDFPVRKRFTTGLAASMFFAVCPLHTEVVSWVIGRVDGVCLAFFLSSLCLYLHYVKSSRSWALYSSLTCFVLSLLSKEMAVTLPPLVVLLNLTLSNEGSLKQSIVKSIKDSAAFWGLLALYFCVRSLALGTIAGGYSGSVGEGLSGSFLERFKSASKILFPFNNELISPGDRLPKQLMLSYRLLGVFLAVRLLLLRVPLKQFKLLLFCVLWFVLSLVPTYQVFNITDSLMCSRFAYFATAPFSIGLAILISPLWDSEQTAKASFDAGKWLERVSVALILFLVFVLTNTTIKNNSSWAHAGSQVRSFREALAQRCSALPPKSLLVLLNAPQRLEGAHMIYNGAMLSVLLSEPLSRPAIANRVISFEPPTYGDPELINASRLRALLHNLPTNECVYWDMTNKKLVDLKFAIKPMDEMRFDLGGLKLANASVEAGNMVAIDSPPLNLDALSPDFVICKLCFKESDTKGFVTLSWKSSNFPSFKASSRISLPVHCDGIEHDYVFPVSEHKSWIAGGRIDHLRLQIPMTESEARSYSPFRSLSILSGKNLIPEFYVPHDQLATGADGIYRLVSDQFELRCNAKNLPGCKQISVEISKPNCWFEHYAGSYREKQYSEQSLKRMVLTGNEAAFKFRRSDFPEAAFYELRAFALDGDGKVIGFCSDPINLQIN